MLDTEGGLNGIAATKNTVTLAEVGKEQRLGQMEYPEQQDTRIEGVKEAWKASSLTRTLCAWDTES